MGKTLTNKIVKIITVLWALMVFIGIPVGLTYQHFFSEKPLSLYAQGFFVLSVFIASFWNVFRKHRKYLLLPQLCKMLLAIYTAIISFANIYKFAGLNIGNGKITHTALDSLYFSIVTWTTLGYGDMHPTESIKLWAATEALLGTIFIPLFLAALLFSINRSKQEAKIVE